MLCRRLCDFKGSIGNTQQFLGAAVLAMLSPLDDMSADDSTQ